MGRIVKVKDMKPGWTYCPVDKTLEEMYWEQRTKYVLRNKCEWETDEEALARDRETHYKYLKEKNLIPNTGVLLRQPREPQLKALWEFEGLFKLYFVHEENEIIFGPTPKGMSGVSLQRTGSKIWTPLKSYPIVFHLGMEDEVMEAHPFTILKIKEGHEPINLPDPERWTVTSGDAPYNPRGIDHVSVWDESDAKILIVLAIVSFFMAMAGPSGCAMAVTIWLFAAIGFKSKHDKKREYILKEREELGVRGDGLDDHIRW